MGKKILNNEHNIITSLLQPPPPQPTLNDLMRQHFDHDHFDVGEIPVTMESDTNANLHVSTYKNMVNVY